MDRNIAMGPIDQILEQQENNNADNNADNNVVAVANN